MHALCNIPFFWQNTSFLDQTWVMPVLRHYELVPCTQLGVLIRYINNRVVVAAVQPGSVAEENVSILILTGLFVMEHNEGGGCIILVILVV